MTEQINKELATLRDNLKDIDSARLTYKEIGTKAEKIIAKSTNLIGNHREILDKLNTASNDLKLERGNLVNIFNQNLTTGIANITKEYKVKTKELTTDFNDTVEELRKTHKVINHKVGVALKEWSQQILDENKALSGEIEKNYKKSSDVILEEIKKYYTEAFDTSNTEIGKNIKKAEELYDKIGETEKKISISIAEHLKAHEDILTKFENTVNEYITKYGSLVDATNELTTEIKGVNFPQRLDKLDSTVSGINIGLQNLQSKVIQFDEKFSDVNKEIEKSTEKITKETENAGKLVLGEIQKVDDKTENLNNNLTAGFKQNTNLLYGIGIIQLIVIIVMIVLHFI